MDFYTTLGIGKNATAADIKSAYRKLTLKWHPDRNKEAGAAEQFKKINAAYEVLSNPQKKQQYDSMGHDYYTKSGAGSAAGQSRGGYGDPFGGGFSYSSTGGFGGFDNADVQDIFETFFGGGFNRQRKAVYELSITFDEAYNGIEKEIQIQSGKRMVKIPAGIDNGNRMRFNDFDLVVRVRSSNTFKREGADLYVEKRISMATAALGGTVEVPTMKGNITLKLRNGTQHDSAVRLRGEGMPVPNTSSKGDLYVIYKVDIPEKLNNKAKKLLEELQKELA